MRNKSRRRVRLCLWLLLGLALLWYFCGYMAERSQQIVWLDFNHKVKIVHPVTGIPYAQFINEYAAMYGLNPQLVAAIIKVESSFQTKAVSPAKAYGLMQVVPDTWQQVNNKVHAHAGPGNIACFTDPELNIHIGTASFAELLKQYKGDTVLALAAYNAGPQSVNQYQAVPPFEETREYVDKIINCWYEFANERPVRPIDSEFWASLQSRLGVGIILIITGLAAVLWPKRGRRRHRWR